MTKPNCYQLAVLLTELLRYFIRYYHIEILYKKTIRKTRLYKFIRVLYSQPLAVNLLIALWSAVCRPEYVAGCASASCGGWYPFLVALCFCVPCGQQSAVRNILLVVVPWVTAVSCCLPCGRRSAALRILLPPLLLNHVKSQRKDIRPVAPWCKFLRRRDSPPLRTAVRNKSARLGESPRSTHKTVLRKPSPRWSPPPRWCCAETITTAAAAAPSAANPPPPPS
jgi:hypothetical protein